MTNKIFSALWAEYVNRTPSAERVKSLFEEHGEQVLNDHIAIRTFNDPRVDIGVISKPFLKLGYVLAGSYDFKEKHLNAHHFEIPGDKQAPRVFISELKLEKFDSSLQGMVDHMLAQISPQDLSSEELILKGRLWGTPSYAQYESMLEQSEYAAWLYINGFCANHFTVSANALKSMNSLVEVNSFLKENGFKLNESGGEIKGSKSDLLEQSSILADRIEMDFEEGNFEVTSCYYEFAYRYHKEEGELFSGFVTGSADKIFESTNMKVS
ncbi:MAG: DUF1338 domain-containing protein [Flavobacteriaceae bacterium]